MPTTYARGYGDANTGGGYGTLRNAQLGADSEAGGLWPYKEKTELEDQADGSSDEEEKSRRAITKKKDRSRGNDRLQQLNYHPNSFVNGQTRGLTGIMSGMDPYDILEQFIVEAGLDVAAQRRGKKGMGNIKPLGTGAPNPSTMATDPTTRTRPGMTLGSKLGWFGPPPPKETDPAMAHHAYSLRDIADDEGERPVRNARIEKSRIRQRDRMGEGKVAILRSYVGCVVDGTVSGGCR